MKRNLLFLLFFCGHSAWAAQVEWNSPQGDNLLLQRLGNGEIWASFTLTDRISADFAPQELIVLQVDDNKPVKLKQAFRSCAAPAAPAQQYSYQFDTQPHASQWKYSGIGSHQSDPLKLLGWDSDDYDSIKADRRNIVVDFPLSRSQAGARLMQQLQHGQSVTFRYVTDKGQARQAVFDLHDQRSQTQRLLAD